MKKYHAGKFNFAVDHMTLLVAPEMYKTAYAIMRIIFGVSQQGILYEKRRPRPGSDGEVSMTFASQIGDGSAPKSANLAKTVIAIVQPSEPEGEPSHVRRMLEDHGASAHWQHIALSVDDLLGFHRHASAHGVNFITPILHDERQDLLQVFSGEWYLPDSKPTGLFFEFVQRDPTPETLKRFAEADRQSWFNSEIDRQRWFRDKVFLGLYEEKEKEYQSGRVVPFMDFDLIRAVDGLLAGKEIWQITDDLLDQVRRAMAQYVEKKSKKLPDGVLRDGAKQDAARAAGRLK